MERAACEGNKRSVTVRLTDEAASVVDECVREFRSMDELVMAGFTDEEEEQLMDLLERLFANAEAIRSSQALWQRMEQTTLSLPRCTYD